VAVVVVEAAELILDYNLQSYPKPVLEEVEVVQILVEVC
jgi:hypothetical protein